MNCHWRQKMQFLKCLRVAFEETRKLISCLPLHAPLPLVHLVSKHRTLHRQHYSFIEMPQTSENIGGPFLTIHDNSDIKVSFWKFLSSVSSQNDSFVSF